MCAKTTEELEKELEEIIKELEELVDQVDKLYVKVLEEIKNDPRNNS